MRDWKTTCLFYIGQYKYPMGGVLSISEGGLTLGGLSEMWQGLDRDEGGVLGWNSHQNIPNSLGIWMSGARLKLPPEHSS